MSPGHVSRSCICQRSLGSVSRCHHTRHVDGRRRTKRNRRTPQARFGNTSGIHTSHKCSSNTKPKHLRLPQPTTQRHANENQSTINLLSRSPLLLLRRPLRQPLPRSRSPHVRLRCWPKQRQINRRASLVLLRNHGIHRPANSPNHRNNELFWPQDLIHLHVRLAMPKRHPNEADGFSLRNARPHTQICACRGRTWCCDVRRESCECG